MSIKELQQRIHQQNIEAGWWENPREKGTLLCLIHSEISEAMEGERKNLMDDHLPHRKMAEVELADAVIRILDYAHAFGYDIEGAITEKLDYNRQRADHKKENRSQPNGKQF
jgi:NTP pyrophosphatase (non-canonical NTP hydrolase)